MMYQSTEILYSIVIDPIFLRLELNSDKRTQLHSPLNTIQRTIFTDRNKREQGLLERKT